MATSLKFLLDEHVATAVADALRRRGLDVVMVKEIGGRGKADASHLALARSEQRVIVTQDADFLAMHARGEPHPGIVYAPQGTPIGTLVRALWRIVDQMDADAMRGHVEFA
jgi:predicted nuclease of predicted toxin-antitoxin system